ncbi:MAG: Eco57I restriction-modification methylase domain-containing protein, partial [Candidatus Brocadiales bacterium]|nr:Eco57I restriction-modification methylase domain-containing protein [Candidatus Brocadiales bacterium]
ITPAKRYSFLVGKNEPNHTAQAQLVGILSDDRKNPTLSELETAFSVDAVTKQFYKDYRAQFEKVWNELNKIVSENPKIKNEFETKSIDTANFAKKLMGQIVFLYFLQKKGWLGVGTDDKGNFKEWGTGPKNFLHELFNKKFTDYNNFFNDLLEPLFYEGLASEHDDDYFSKIDCKIPFLNGGLFEPINRYNWQETDICIDNDVIAEVFSTFDRYNFTVREDEPLEKEVAVDPEMLGKVFENLLPDNLRKGQGAYYTPRTIVHYMCQESLINYLDTACEPVPKQDIETLIREGDIILELETAITEGTKSDTSVLMDTIKENAQALDDALADIKVCDPAIGSGAFPVGMLTEIVRARKVLELYLSGKHTIYELKRHCIQNSLYGVDIDPGAIEIAKLRLWLSLVVDEDNYEKIQPLPNLDYKIMQGNSLIEEFHGISLDIEKKPDNKDESVLFGENSEIDKLIDELHERQQSFFNAVHHREKGRRKIAVEKIILKIFRNELRKQKQPYFTELRKIEDKADMLKIATDRATYLTEAKTQMKRRFNNFDVDQVEAELTEMTHGNKTRNFFPWKLYFADVFRGKGGFDVVIANPPYIQLQKSLDDGTNNKYADLYKNCGYETFKRTGDIYALFYELGINVLKDGGHLTFITSNKWMRAGYGDVLRGYFAKHNPKILLDFGGFKVFESATVDVNIIVVDKSNSTILVEDEHKQDTCVTLATHFKNDFNEGDSVAEYVKNNSVELTDLTDDTWFIGSKTEIALKQKIEEIGTPLKDWDVNIYRGVLTGYNNAFIIDETKRAELIAQDPKSEEIIKPVLGGKNLLRYGYEFAGLYLIATLPALNLDIDDYPAVRDYLKSFGKRLHQTGEPFIDENGIKVKSRKRTFNKWFETQDPIAYYAEFAKEKVVWLNLNRKWKYSYVDPNIMVEASLNFLSGDKYIKTIVGIMSSKLQLWFFRTVGRLHDNGGYMCKIDTISNSPIPPITASNRHLAERIEKLVELRLVKT